MVDKAKSNFKKGMKVASGLPLLEKAGKAIEKPLRTGASAARRSTAAALKEQQQKESIKLAETESEIATKRALTKSGKGGRKSLIKSSPSGLAQNLGGTQ